MDALYLLSYLPRKFFFFFLNFFVSDHGSCGITSFSEVCSG